MSAPRIIIQIVIVGAQIFGKALLEAGRQAAKNAKYQPAAGMASDAAGVHTATSGSVTDVLTRQHRMTLDEAHLILNVKRGEEMETVLRKYEHLFQANSPPPPPQPGAAPAGRQPAPYSHYLQSKVVRAKERIEAEMKVGQEPPPPSPDAPPRGPGAESAGGGGS